MNEVSLTADEADVAIAGSASAGQRLFRNRVLMLLRSLTGCVLRIREGRSTVEVGTPAAQPEQTLRAMLTVRDPEFYRRAALGGSVGAAESFMDGEWECDDLVALVRILVRNRNQLDAMERGPARLAGAAMQLWSACRRNTRSGSRRNIAAHYDLGNDFFRLFLDDNLMYSSAIYATPADTLEEASRRKLDRICQKLQLEAGTRVIEIGTGWGGFALHAARTTGCHVTTATISREQHALACERVAAAGLQDRVQVLLTDYRELTGKYDRLVSIEMIEAIGHQYLDTYFGKVGALLEDDGMALIQAITIEDHRYAQALRSVDFIKRHVFPGSFIPSVSAMLASMAGASDMKLFHLEDIGPSYALTLREWRRRFLSQLDRVRAMGYPDRFVRMWEFYLAYCEGGFIERSTGDVQMLLVKPGARRTEYVTPST
ncbi:MAG TPA: cyclopropane-fatty-acyl-phospholipid synthase family protein [Steroidobacteraceae bacterium]|jgi:cyclopropane-fatty-acyl-phospholipid synthase|nr:cyclopropane-fatty-acyl-phospholipid synthase family protein [Steroidobacteraceae bacterium]